MNPEIAGLRVVFAGDTAGYDTASDKVKADLRRVEGMGSRITSVGDSLMSAGRGLMIATAPVALAFGSGVKTASDFESVMKEIQARAGLTGEEMQRVSDFALKMGADTQFSGLQAGQALLELMSSGQSVEQAMGTLPAVMEGAAAGAMDLGNAGDLVTDVMAMFGLSVADSYKIMDTLSRGAALVAGPAFMVLGSVVKGVGVAMNVAFGPVGILLGAIGVGLVFINEKFGSLENAINLARTAAGQLGFLMWKALTDASGAAGELVGKITGGLTIAVQDLGVTVRRMAGGIGIAFTDVGNALGQLFWNLGNSVGSFITARIVTAMQAYGLLAYLMGDGQKMVEIAKQIEQIQKPMGPYVPTPYADWMVGYANEQYQGRAMGGGVSAGQPYMVGERGPELFVPGRTGMIVPNRALGGSGGGVINLHVVLRGENFEDHIYERVAVALR